MSATEGGSAGRRLLILLGVGLLLVLAWGGGRMSAGSAGPFGMMDGGPHGEGMMGGGHMRDGEQRRAGSFGGEAGLQRCRALLGTMAGMHQSMQSMMGMEARGDSSGTPPHRGMMGGRRGRMHEGMKDERTENREPQMRPEQMRRMCRTMHEAMRAAMHGEAMASSSGAADGTVEGRGVEEETAQWLQRARGAESVVDRTGEDEVVVEVGAGDGLRYAPAAIRVDPGTTVRWRWTGRGGLHDVAFRNADVSASLRDEAGATFSHTFDTPGEYRYECTPHAAVGMRGVVIVTAPNSS